MTTNTDTTIAVLMGGMSSERPISMKSGKAVAAALRSRGHNVVEIDVGPNLPSDLRNHQVDVAWLALHGSFGEDGCVQGLLEIMRIPYTGSGVRASAIAMDKIATKRILRGTDIPLPEDTVWNQGDPTPHNLTYPVVAKTPNGGSTIGIHICEDEASLTHALNDCGRFEPSVLLEQFVSGKEITVALIDGTPMPVVEIRPSEGFFDFEAKYTKGQTEYLVPAPIDPVIAATAQQYAQTAFRAVGLSGIARADFIVDNDGIPWFLEINTIPGMTATSLTPMAAGANGISFEELVEMCLKGAQLHNERDDQKPTEANQKPNDQQTLA
ncbi:MAG: D-alanine--D-alanine ligase, partial [Myxococcota bacterium]